MNNTPISIVGYDKANTGTDYTQDDFLRALYMSVSEKGDETLQLSAAGQQLVKSLIPNFPAQNSNLSAADLNLIRTNLSALYAKVDLNGNHIIDENEADGVNKLFVGEYNGVKGTGEVSGPEPIVQKKTTPSSNGVGLTTNVEQTLARLDEYKRRVAANPNYNPVGLNLEDYAQAKQDLFNLASLDLKPVHIQNGDAPTAPQVVVKKDDAPAAPANTGDIVVTNDAKITTTGELTTNAVATASDVTTSGTTALQAPKTPAEVKAPATSAAQKSELSVVTIAPGQTLSQILAAQYPDLFTKNGKPDWSMLPLISTLVMSMETNSEALLNSKSSNNDGFWVSAGKNLSLPKDSAGLVKLLSEKSAQPEFVSAAEQTRSNFASKYGSKAFSVETSALIASLKPATDSNAAVNGAVVNSAGSTQ